MSPEPVSVRDQDRVRWIVLDRPESKNGLTVEVNARIKAAIEEAAERRDLRVLVLTGASGNFCSGLDLKAAMQMGGADIEKSGREYFHGLIRAVRACPKPVLALVDGAAVGFGCDLALACDLRIGTDRTRFGEVFVRRGLMPDGGGTFTLPRLVGVGKALELMLTGELVEADEALRLGLVTRRFAHAEAERETHAFARKLASGPPLVYARVKAAVYGAVDLDSALERELAGQLELLRSKDFFEGVTAFFQKREPDFKGE
jgi:2-(1,2-epoxy-1,2-dihydrophenyl)acetyl-CoA isomerase